MFRMQAGCLLSAVDCLCDHAWVTSGSPHQLRACSDDLKLCYNELVLCVNPEGSPVPLAASGQHMQAKVFVSACMPPCWAPSLSLHQAHSSCTAAAAALVRPHRSDSGSILITDRLAASHDHIM
jgi:hypothetical protein